MTAAATSHALAPDLALLAPPSFAIRPSAQGLVGSEAGSGAVLSLLLKPTAAGGVGHERLIESALAMMQKKHAGAERIGAPQTISVDGSSGRSALMRATTTANASIHIVLTTVIAPDPANAQAQRNLIAVLEVPTAAFEQRREHYLGLVQRHLRIGAVRSAQPPPVLELAPMEAPKAPEPAPAATELPPAAVLQHRSDPPARARPQATPVPADEGELLASAAQGQRTLAISIALSLVARAIGNVPDVPVFLAYAIAAAVLIYAISGVLKICSGFGYSMNAKLALMFLSSVPLAGIAAWVYLSVKTTRRLRAAGYRVGLFGARA